MGILSWMETLSSISSYWNGNIEELSMTNKNNPSLPLSLPHFLSPSLAVSKFFLNSSEQRTDVLHLMLDRLNNVYLRWFENQTAFKLFATSLLLVYEGDCSQPISPNELLAIRLVDFAHAIPGDAKPDENILFGLRKFIEFLQILT